MKKVLAVKTGYTESVEANKSEIMDGPKRVRYNFQFVVSLKIIKIS